MRVWKGGEWWMDTTQVAKLSRGEDFVGWKRGYAARTGKRGVGHAGGSDPAVESVFPRGKNEKLLFWKVESHNVWSVVCGVTSRPGR